MARPVQAAFTSAGTFTTGAVLPLLAAALATGKTQIVVAATTALVFLAALGAVGARPRPEHVERLVKPVSSSRRECCVGC